MVLKKSTKPVAELEASDVSLLRIHPSHPILVTQEDARDEPYPHLLIHTPRYFRISGGASNRLDLGAMLTLPPMTTARAEALQPDAHMKGYSVTSVLLSSGDEVILFFRNYTNRMVEFQEGDVVGMLTFQRHRALSMEVRVALPPTPIRGPIDGRAVDEDVSDSEVA